MEKSAAFTWERNLRLAAVAAAITIFAFWMIMEHQSVVYLICIPEFAALLVCSYSLSIGQAAVAAVAVGLAMAVFTGKSGYVGIFGATSLLSSLFWPLGRVMCAAAFLAGAMGLGMLYEPELLYQLIPSLLAGTAIFFMVPADVEEKIRDTFGERIDQAKIEEQSYKKKSRKLHNAVCEQARRYRDLSKAFGDVDVLCEMFLECARVFETFEESAHLHAAQKKFKLTMGVSRSAGSSEYISGDNYSACEADDAREFIMLSDGMGSGEQAYCDSDHAIDCMERLVENGFSADTAVKILAKSLTAKKRQDVGVTVDAAVFDLQTGHCSMIKAGAAASFLIRPAIGKIKCGVEILESESMPLGIFEDVSCSRADFYMAPGNVLVMMTDGVLDALKGEIKEECMRGFLEYEISQLRKYDAADMAKLLCEAVMEFAMAGAGENRDDMTVLAFVCERSGSKA